MRFDVAPPDTERENNSIPHITTVQFKKIRRFIVIPYLV